MSRRVRVSERTDSSSVQHSHFLNLPAEVTEHILSHLRVHDWNCLRLVCRKVCDTVDQSSVWKRTWISLQSAPESGSDMWKLLQIRRIVSLDLTEIDRQVDAVGKSLNVLPKLRGLRVNSRAMYFLGCFHMDSLLEYVRLLEIIDHGNVGSLFTLDNNWVPLVAATLSNITNLVVQNLRTQISEFVEKITPLDKLEVLDLEVAGSISTRSAVDIRDFAKLLYMHPNLTALRIHQMALKSTRELADASPFDPRICPEFGYRVLQLKSLDLQLIRSDALNGFGDYKLLKTSDLQYMPRLTKLKYTVTGTQLTRYPIYEVDVEDWNITCANAAATRPRLEYLHLELLRGVCERDFDISVLEKLPKTLKYFSICGEFQRVSMIISAIGIGLGATLTELKVHLTEPLNDHQLCHISNTFVVLRYLTASLCEDIKPASIMPLGKLTSFRRLTLMSPVIPNTTIHAVRAAMTREFLIIQHYLD